LGPFRKRLPSKPDNEDAAEKPPGLESAGTVSLQRSPDLRQRRCESDDLMGAKERYWGTIRHSTHERGYLL
jgi:hypothetical protein